MKLNYTLFLKKIIIIVLCILIGIIGYKLITFPKKEHFSITKPEDVEDVKGPFANVYDNKGNKLNVILVSKPFDDKENTDFAKNNKNKYIFVGITSYLEFPNKSSNPLDHFPNYDKNKYLDMCEAWLHCMRNPEDYFRPETPLALISESDFINCHINAPNPAVHKKYDFVYICLKVKKGDTKCDDWATYNKNWTLAKKCLDVMCKDFGLKGLLIGRKNCELPKSCHSLMESTEILDSAVLKYAYQSSKFIFLPNIADASPRVLSEALCSDLPCLMNKNILGGWKYLNENTGEFFNDEHDIGDSIGKLLRKMNMKQYIPRKYFIENYGVIHSGKRLKEFLYSTFGDRLNIPKSEVEYITLAYKNVDYSHCTLDEVKDNKVDKIE
jgi:hypothetical protein